MHGVLMTMYIIKCTLIKLNIFSCYDKIQDFTAMFGRLYYIIRIIVYYRIIVYIILL